MSLPRGDEYYSAIQNPVTAFQDLELKACSVETNQLGLPKPYAGGFTTTYHLYNSNNQDWAVRCFTKDIHELQKRYDAIGRFFNQNPHGIFVKTKYLRDGIRVNIKGQLYPIIKMQWLDGDTLNIFIDKNINNKAIISRLLPEFLNLVQHLENMGIAHGDMQHGNIIIKNGKFYLIDYDGMYVPELSGLKTNEIGHVNYQHPLRNASHYDATIDRFSSIVIYLGLMIVSVSPQLWKKYDNGDNILFCSNDFLDTDNSALLSELLLVTGLSTLVEGFKGVCRLDFDKIPTLNQFISGNFVYPKSTPIVKTVNLPRNQYAVIDASQTALLMQYIGLKVNVIGFIDDYKKAIARNHQPYIFMNFGFYPKQTFKLVLWSPTLYTLNQQGINYMNFINKWVSVIGAIVSYNGKPQMEIEFPSQIQILSSEKEAKQRLSEASQPIQPTLTQAPSPSTHSLRTRISTNKIHDVDILNNPNVEIFNNLYKDKTATSAPKTYPSVTYTPTSPLPRPPPNKTPAKKESNVFYGILFSIIFGSLGFAVMGFLGILVGIVIGYQIGKRL